MVKSSSAYILVFAVFSVMAFLGLITASISGFASYENVQEQFLKAKNDLIQFKKEIVNLELTLGTEFALLEANAKEINFLIEKLSKIESQEKIDELVQKIDIAQKLYEDSKNNYYTTKQQFQILKEKMFLLEKQKSVLEKKMNEFSNKKRR